MENIDPVTKQDPNKRYQVTLEFIQAADAMQVENQNLQLENNLLKELHDAASSTQQIWVRVLLLIDALSLSDSQKQKAVDVLDRQIRDRALMLIGAHLQSDDQLQHAIDVLDGNLDALKELNKFDLKE
ncbi:MULTISPECIES: hypothetical protein [Paenibacillus]|uniref:hypothetical protein n=1 Tax=Paenibacillus TaxID=44249 RepID=UPI0004647826|nr:MULTISPECIES: hypothetical protein [Paenibacillus]KGP81124.1 hypothetical protein P364_0117680 [Paenibacillus sp. MAEPY2]KGP86166.1 hypothetical protein P363_0119030 [Paenibacillus sp. MAEPY1]OZQ71032.1 hypothetical protein CA599_10870 [Paenibacillus taichungensis]